MNEKNKLFVIFGATGDLTKRKLIPAFYNLYKNSKLKENFTILGASEQNLTDELFQETSLEHIKEFTNTEESKINKNFLKKLHYNQLNLNEIQGYKYLLERINKMETENTEIIFYLAIPPQLF